MESDILLIQRAVRGDIGAFEILFQAHFQAVYNYALHLSSDPALAEDLTQETFIRAHRSLSRFGRPWKIRPWLFQITRNLIRDDSRRARDLPDIDEEIASLQDSQPGPEQTLLSMERSVRIRTALRGLPSQHREALILRELGELSYEDIATTMGISTQYVRVLIHRARAKFQESYTLRLLAEEALGCGVLAERLDALHDGEPFSQEEERFVREHLHTCRSCQERQRDLANLSVMWSAVLTVPPPSTLGGRIWQRVRASRQWSQLGQSALVGGGLVVAALFILLLLWIGWRGLNMLAVSPSPTATQTPTVTATFVSTTTLTPPSTSNVLFYTPTSQPAQPLIPVVVATNTFTPPSISQPNISQPDIPSAPPTPTFTPKPPTPVPDTNGPSVTKVGHKPDPIFASGPGSCSATTTVVSASLSDPSGIQNAEVIYAHTSFGSVPMSNVGGSTWSATLGPFDSVGDGTVDYQIRVFDNAGNRSDTPWKTVTINPCLK